LQRLVAYWKGLFESQPEPNIPKWEVSGHDDDKSRIGGGNDLGAAYDDPTNASISASRKAVLASGAKRGKRAGRSGQRAVKSKRGKQ
jgi:hypothetical protein